MTTYNHTLTFDEVESIAILNLVQDAIDEFKLKHAEDGLPVPWVWESIQDKFRRADNSLSSRSNFAIDNLKKLIEYGKAEKWCMKYCCGTCGADEFRGAIQNLFTRNQLIEGLRDLDSDFVNHSSNRSALLLILHDLNIVGFQELSKELEFSPAGAFLNKAITIEANRRHNHQQRMLNQEIAKKNAMSAKAQKNIWGAIKRKDFLAIDNLLGKGVDLHKTNDNGLSLEQALKNLGKEK